MQNTSHNNKADSPAALDADPQYPQDTLQAYFKADVSPDEIEQVFHLKRAQPLLQAFTALFHGGFNGVLVRLLVLRELAADAHSPTFFARRHQPQAVVSGAGKPGNGVGAAALASTAGVGRGARRVSGHADCTQCAVGYR
ncbi:hypothetical protein ACFS07_23165 [Undibacterium arcticum]